MSRSVEKDENFYKLTAFKQRENYISTISHDLKIPVIAQMRALELLSDESLGTLNPQQKEMIDLTLESCKSVYDMLGAILASYKFENREVLLNKDILNIEKIINDIFYSQKKLLKYKNINVNLKINSSALFADKKQLKTALNNIIEFCLNSALNNSFLTIETKNCENNYEFIFKFQPINISSDRYNAVFENSYDSLDKIGTNLNLCLANKIIEAHSGNIKFKQIFNNLLIIVNICTKFN